MIFCVSVVHRFASEFEPRLGYILYGINILLSLAIKNNFAVDLWEWAVIVSTAIHQFDPVKVSKFKVRWMKPSKRCLTLANWYQVRVVPILYGSLFVVAGLLRHKRHR